MAKSARSSETDANDVVAAWRAVDVGANSPAVRASFGTIRLANAIVAISEREIHRPGGTSWGGFGVLFSLSLLGPLEIRTIARLAEVSKQAISTTVTTLERDGLVRRERGVGGDDRRVAVRLTPAGRRHIAKAVAAQDALTAQLMSPLTAEECVVLAALVERVLAGLDLDRDQ